MIGLLSHMYDRWDGRAPGAEGEGIPVSARIVPVAPEEELHVRPPRPDAPALHEVALPAPLELGIDVVDVLLEERQRGR